MEGMEGHGGHHSSEMNSGSTQNPEAKAKADVAPIVKALSLSNESKDSLQKFFTNYYQDVAFYGDKLTDRLRESLVLQRNKRACKILDSLQCQSYLDLVKADTTELQVGKHSFHGAHS